MNGSFCILKGGWSRHYRKQMEREQREIGTPQGGVVSPVLANLFLHHVFDKWMEKHYPDNPWCRYADDGLVHARNRNKAEILKRELEARFYCMWSGNASHEDKNCVLQG